MNWLTWFAPLLAAAMRRDSRGDKGDAGEQGEQGERGESGKMTRNAGRAFVVMVAIFCVVLAVMGYYINQNAELGHQNKTLIRQTRVLAHQAKVLAEQGREAKLGICSYKADLRARTRASAAGLKVAEKYLHDHPNGNADFPKATIQSAIFSQAKTLAAQRAALDALRVLNCS